ncbi:MAG: hypothetical protein A2Z25_17270 [Planctomycetes bacterium RBG_16_55_9]|nr:MAG: hypothetical protein A2Z25_17270 [Planctomycetes bacterium RBG_16_55_9]
MTQNRETGAAANEFGKNAARKIAQQLQLKRASKVSNEVSYNGQRAVIKSAHLGNHYIGVTLNRLDRIDLIIAAFENTDGHFDLYTLDTRTFKDNVRIGHHEHIGLVKKKIFLENGQYLKTMSV